MTDMTSTQGRKLRVLLLAPRSERPPALRFLIRDTELLSRAVDEVEAEIVTLDSQGEYGALISEVALQIPRTLESADAVIADLTGADPNVMYELGFAHALKKPVLPIVQKGKPSIPADLQGYLYYVYDPDRVGELLQTVTLWLRRALVERRP